MKKLVYVHLFIIGLALTCYIMACSKTNNQPSNTSNVDKNVLGFYKSDDYRSLSNNALIKNAGTLSLEESYVRYIDKDKQVPVIYLVFKSGNQVRSVVEAIKLSQPDRLPNNQMYAMAFRDYQRYDLSKKEGTIRIYDLNWENNLASEIVIENKQVKKWDVNPIPDNLKVKYAGVSKGKINNSQNEGKVADTQKEEIMSVAGTHLCDKNGNGDVGFTECYKCMKDACGTSADCEFLCDIADLNGSCTISIAAACVYISATN